MQTNRSPSPLQQSIEQLSQQLATISEPEKPTLIQLSSQIQATSPLLWLNAQTHFPKLYWHSRDGGSEAATCGELDCWRLSQSQPSRKEWLRHATHTVLEWRYYGGHGFTPDDPKVTELGGNRLYLPKFEYRREQKSHWLICYLALEPEQWQNQRAQAQADLNQLKEPQAFAATTFSIEEREEIPDYDHWARLITQLTQKEQLQLTPKVVPCREKRLSTHEPINSWQLLNDWQNQQPHCYQFGIQSSAHQSFFGCSPERLFLRNQQTLFTEALAGTCSKGETAEQSRMNSEKLLQDPKNIHENELVADDIQQQLRPLTHTIQLESNAHLVELSQINHLCRDIQGRLKSGVNEIELLKALHPTAAIGGLPRDAARAFLEEHEEVERGWYAGVFGMVGDQTSEFCVTIRSMQQQGNQLSLYAGAGVVAGSEPEAEWQEIDSKLASAMAVLQNYQK